MASLVIFMLIMLTKKVSSNDRHTVKPNPVVCSPGCPAHWIPMSQEDRDLIQFALTLEYGEAEYFLHGSLGRGLDEIAPELVMGGPPPIGAEKANLDRVTRAMIEEFGYQEVGHIRAIQTTVGGFPRPLLDISAKNFANVINEAFGYKLEPPFNPYHDNLSYMLLAGLLGVEAGQDAVIRKHLYDRKWEVVHPYNHTVAEFTNRISKLCNRLAQCGIKDEGIWVPRFLGAESMTVSNVLSADRNSLSYGRTPEEILRIVYGTGDEHVPSGFYPEGANGAIARRFLNKYT